MTQEEKLLLLKDLCARLPYNLYVMVEEFNVPKNEAITEGFVGNYLKDNRCNDYDADDILNELADGCIDVKPYLRPMRSITEEEIKELSEIDMKRVIFSSRHLTWHLDGEIIDYLNKKMLDWRGLIPKGLAIEAPEGMYK